MPKVVRKYNRFGRSYSGLDCSGPNRVLPPTFEGVRKLVDRVGEQAAALTFSNPPVTDEPNFEEGIFLDFLDDFNNASDKVERLTLLREFNQYLDGVKQDLETPPEPEPELEPEKSPEDSQK